MEDEKKECGICGKEEGIGEHVIAQCEYTTVGERTEILIE